MVIFSSTVRQSTALHEVIKYLPKSTMDNANLPSLRLLDITFKVEKEIGALFILLKIKTNIINNNNMFH